LLSSPGLRWSGRRHRARGGRVVVFAVVVAWALAGGESGSGRRERGEQRRRAGRGTARGARHSGHEGKARQAGRRGACIELENFLTFSLSMHGQHKVDIRRFNLSASAALKNDFRPLKYSSQVRLSRYIHLRSAICIVKQETYQHPSKMNTNGPKIAFGPQL